jgi:hypothetical protein
LPRSSNFAAKSPETSSGMSMVTCMAPAYHTSEK